MCSSVCVAVLVALPHGTWSESQHSLSSHHVSPVAPNLHPFGYSQDWAYEIQRTIFAGVHKLGRTVRGKGGAYSDVVLLQATP